MRKTETAEQFLGKDYLYTLSQFQNYLYGVSIAATTVSNTKHHVNDIIRKKYPKDKVLMINTLLKPNHGGIFEKAWKDTLSENGCHVLSHNKVTPTEFLEKFIQILQDILK